MQAWMALVPDKHQSPISMNLFRFISDLRLAETHAALTPVELAEHIQRNLELMQRVLFSKPFAASLDTFLPILLYNNNKGRFFVISLLGSTEPIIVIPTPTNLPIQLAT
jgi:hypothetical protein